MIRHRLPRSLLVGALLLALASAWGCNKSLGTKLDSNGCELYYTDGVSPKAAREALKFLVDDGFCDGTRKTTQLATAEGGEYRFRIVWKEEALDDETYLAAAELFGANLSSRILEGAPVAVDLCDTYLQTLKTIEAPHWGAVTKREECELFAPESVSDAERDATLTVLKEMGHCAGPASFRITRGDPLALSVVIKAEARDKPEVVRAWRVVAGAVSSKAFEGAPMTLHMTNERFEPKVTAAAVVLGPAAKRGACEVRYMDDTLKGEAEKVAALFEAVGYCAGGEKSYRVTRDGDTWHVGAVAGGQMNDEVMASLAPAFRLVAGMLRSEVFAGAPTVYDICDPVFEGCRPHPGADLGKVAHRNQCHVFYPRDGSLTDAARDKLLDLMEAEQLCGAEQLVRLSRQGEGWLVQLPVAEAAAAQAPAYGAAVTDFKAKITPILGGSAPALVATDLDMKTLKTF